MKDLVIMIRLDGMGDRASEVRDLLEGDFGDAVLDVVNEVDPDYDREINFAVSGDLYRDPGAGATIDLNEAERVLALLGRIR